MHRISGSNPQSYPRRRDSDRIREGWLGNIRRPSRDQALDRRDRMYCVLTALGGSSLTERDSTYTRGARLTAGRAGSSRVFLGAPIRETPLDPRSALSQAA